MDDIIVRLRQHHYQFNLPGNETQINYLSMMLKGENPDPFEPIGTVFTDLISLYRDHNGMPLPIADGSSFPIRMMSVEEALPVNSLVRRSGWLDLSQRLFWTDDESNYAGIYTQPPLTGCVFYLDHDFPDEGPRFRSVRRFYEALLKMIENQEKYDRGWRSIRGDYPKRAPELQYDAEDLAAAQVYIDLYQQEKDADTRRSYASIAMKLLPFDQREPVVMFADDQRDMYIQQDAIDLFGLRRDHEAVDQIKRIALMSQSNPRTAGIIALGSIGTDQAREALLELGNLIIDTNGNYKSLIASALKRVNVETRDENGVLSYRLNPSDPWIDFTGAASDEP